MRIDFEGDFLPDDIFWQELLSLFSTYRYRQSQLRDIIIKISRELNMTAFSSWKESDIEVRSRDIVERLREQVESGNTTYIKRCLPLLVVDGSFSYEDLNILLKRTNLRCVCKEQLLTNKRLKSDYYNFSKENALLIIERILTNFDKFISALIDEPVHGSAGVSQVDWNVVSIKNEYDVQRMLYAWLRPLFPTIRSEVYSDSGYVGMRADLFLDDYDLIIEVKCTRKNLNQKKLYEEISSDGWNYRADNVYIYIYDKMNIIKNKDAFEKSFRNHSTRDKRYRAFVTKPVNGGHISNSVDNNEPGVGTW